MRASVQRKWVGIRVTQRACGRSEKIIAVGQLAHDGEFAILLLRQCARTRAAKSREGLLWCNEQ